MEISNGCLATSISYNFSWLEVFRTKILSLRISGIYTLPDTGLTSISAYTPPNPPKVKFLIIWSVQALIT